VCEKCTDAILLRPVYESLSTRGRFFGLNDKENKQGTNEMFEGTQGSRIFIVHCHCANCQRPSARRVAVPPVENAPATVEAFIEAMEHNPIPFVCRHCESLIGDLVGVTMEREDEPA
jgi:hypothetical protein